MASTPWGIEAEGAWAKCLHMREKAKTAEWYDLPCIFCKEPVFMVDDTMSRMPGHIYSDAGAQEYANTRICEFCYDKHADVWDDVCVSLVKLYPQNSEMAWMANGKHWHPAYGRNPLG